MIQIYSKILFKIEPIKIKFTKQQKVIKLKHKKVKIILEMRQFNKNIYKK